jgi:hypothetical protein
MNFISFLPEWGEKPNRGREIIRRAEVEEHRAFVERCVTLRQARRLMKAIRKAAREIKRDE